MLLQANISLKRLISVEVSNKVTTAAVAYVNKTVFSEEIFCWIKLKVARHATEEEGAHNM